MDLPMVCVHDIPRSKRKNVLTLLSCAAGNLLAETGNKFLLEMGDRFGHMCRWQGRVTYMTHPETGKPSPLVTGIIGDNVLGKLIMGIRDEIAQDKQTTKVTAFP